MARYLPSPSRDTLPLRCILGACTFAAFAPKPAPASPGSARLQLIHQASPGSARLQLIHQASSGSARLWRACPRPRPGISWERTPPAHSPGVPWERAPLAHSPPDTAHRYCFQRGITNQNRHTTANDIRHRWFLPPQRAGKDWDVQSLANPNLLHALTYAVRP